MGKLRRVVTGHNQQGKEEMIQKYHAGVPEAGIRFESARTFDPAEAFRRMVES